MNVTGEGMRHETPMNGKAAPALEIEVETFASDQREDAVGVRIERERHVRLDQCRGEAVAKHVRREPPAESGLFGERAQPASNGVRP